MSLDLRAERIDRGLTLDMLAEEIGVPKSTLARIEQGGVPNAPTQLKLATFYGKRPTEIWPLKAAA